MNRLIRLGIVNCFGGGGGSTAVGETEEMKAQQEINAQLWEHYVENYKPQIEKYSEMKTDPAIAEGEKKKVAGQVNADVMKRVPGPSENIVKGARVLSEAGRTEAAAQVEGQGAARSHEISGLQNVIDIGRGKATTADVGLRELSSESVRTAIANKSSERLEEEATSEAYGSLAGATAAGLLKYKKPSVEKG